MVIYFCIYCEVYVHINSQNEYNCKKSHLLYNLYLDLSKIQNDQEQSTAFELIFLRLAFRFWKLTLWFLIYSFIPSFFPPSYPFPPSLLPLRPFSPKDMFRKRKREGEVERERKIKKCWLFASHTLLDLNGAQNLLVYRGMFQPTEWATWPGPYLTFNWGYDESFF